MSSKQIALNLPYREAYGRPDYLVSSSNQEAVSFIDEWPAWNSHVLVLYGDHGCGKTHLSSVWEDMTGAKRIGLSDLNEEILTAPEMVFIMENAEKIREHSRYEEGLFFLYNWLKESGGYLMLTSHFHPNEWGIKLPDLLSRILSAPAIKIGNPDDYLLQGVLVKQFSDRQILPSLDVIKYILRRMERSYAAARKIVNEIDALALSEKKPITIPLVRKVFEAIKA